FGEPIRNRFPVLRRMPEAARQPFVMIAAPEEESSVLADNAVDGPHPSHLIAPACRSGGDGNDAHSGLLQPLDRRIGLGSKASPEGESFVHIGQDITNAAKC